MYDNLDFANLVSWPLASLAYPQRWYCAFLFHYIYFTMFVPFFLSLFYLFLSSPSILLSWLLFIVVVIVYALLLFVLMLFSWSVWLLSTQLTCFRLMKSSFYNMTRWSNKEIFQLQSFPNFNFLSFIFFPP